MSERGGDLSDAERARLRSLSARPEPPPGLEDDTVRALRGAGLLAPAPRRGWLVRASWTAAAVVLGFLIGLGWRGSAPGTHDGRQFLLLVHSTPESAGSVAPEETSRRVAEYGAWARGLDGLVSAGKLRAEADLLRRVGGKLQVTAGAQAVDAVGGYFLLQADERERALEIAATCPHLDYGGWLELREIER